MITRIFALSCLFLLVNGAQVVKPEHTTTAQNEDIIKLLDESRVSQLVSFLSDKQLTKAQKYYLLRYAQQQVQKRKQNIVSFTRAVIELPKLLANYAFYGLISATGFALLHNLRDEDFREQARFALKKSGVYFGFTKAPALSNHVCHGILASMGLAAGGFGLSKIWEKISQSAAKPHQELANAQAIESFISQLPTVD